MSTTVGNGRWKSRVVLLGPAMMLLCLVPRTSDSFEPHYPANEQLRRTIREVWDRQAVRPPEGLEQRLREALRSINEVEGQTDATVADQLATELKTAWRDLERARAIGALGYSEFDEEKFKVAESKLEEVVAQLRGAHPPSPAERSTAVVQALWEVQALSRAARHTVPGLSSDDVLLMREKRQRLLIKEPRGEDNSFPVRSGNETGLPR